MATEQLPPFVLAELYPSSLVVLDTEGSLPVLESTKAAILAPKAAQEPQFFGNNNKKISILVEEPTAVFLTDDNLNFLSTVLGACKLNIGDVAIFNIASSDIVFEKISTLTAPAVCLLFGIETHKVQIPFRIPEYQQQAYGGCNFLVVPGFDRYAATNPDAKLEKTKLWVSLKKLFNV